MPYLFERFSGSLLRMNQVFTLLEYFYLPCLQLSVFYPFTHGIESDEILDRSILLCIINIVLRIVNIEITITNNPILFNP
jgi:hypothetical protein